MRIKLAAEFGLLIFVQEGDGLPGLPLSDGSYLEYQDMFRFSGIERDVYLYATNKLNIRDTKIVATLDDSYTNGLLNVNIEVDNYKWEKGVS